MWHIVTKFIEKNQLLTKGATVLIGVSGGPDSLALLYYYHSIRKEWNLNLIALAVDHQLRGADSKEDIDYVKKVCAEWHVKCITTAVDVQTYKQEHRIGTQVAARDLRYHFFARQMDIHHADYLALGHHADDQVETMLMGFVRSASPVALSGIPMMRKFHTGSIVRPLLCVTKADIIEYCNESEIIPRIDLSNEDTNYTRNYFRKHIIPIIKEKNSNIHTTVQRLSESLQDDEQFLRDQAYEMVCKIVHLEKKSKQASFKINLFKSYPHSLQRRSYHLILDYLYNQLPGNLSYVHEDIFFALLEDSQGNAKIDFPNDLKVEKSYDTVSFSFLGSKLQKTTHQKELQIPGEIDLPNQSKLIATYTNQPSQQDDHVWICATEHVSLPIHVRTRQPGDRMSWQGLDGTKKIKDIFIDAKIPRKDRDTWPIVIDNQGEVLWLIGLRKGKQQLQTKGSPLYIELRYEGKSMWEA